MKQLLFTILLLSLFVIVSFGQTVIYGQQTLTYKSHDQIFNPAATTTYGSSRDFYPVSPQVGSLGIFGQIPVGNFTGTAQINIPIYELKYQELSVPISISYHASGNKPDIIPGPVGLGWTLQAGGVITRTINGIPDNGPINPYTGSGVKRLGWIDFRDEKNWYDSNILKSQISNQELAFERGYDPDEYYFNINGQTGKFYKDYTDTFKVQSKQGESFFVIINASTYDIFGFTMIDTKGVKYNFGGIAATEYTQPGLNYTSFYSLLKLSDYVLPTSWYLNSIESPNGYKINFIYGSRNVLSKVRFTDFSGCYNLIFPGTSNYMDREKSNLISSYYLTEINSPLGKVKFLNSVASKQLGYPALPPRSDINESNFLFDVNANVLPFSMPTKIDNILVQDNDSNEVHKFNLNYTSDYNIRLKLLSLDEVKTDNGAPNDLVLSQYKFEYNQTSLPSYLSGKTDNYGFYNGKDFFSTDIKNKINTVLAAQTSSNIASLSDLVNNAKLPDTTLVRAEILEKITYPTGGYTVFKYEPNDYGCKNHIWPFNVENNTNGIQVTGGVRIRSILNYDNNNNKIGEKIYHYIKNFSSGGTISSGVLAYTPQYIESF
jgi:hypothetical protein